MIHETSVVHHNVKLGENITIEPYVVIKPFVEIGNNVYIDSHTVIGGIPQDRNYKGNNINPAVLIEDNVTIKEFVTIHRGTNSCTVIGKDTMIMAYVHIGHDCRIGDSVVITNNSTLGGYVKVGDNAFISAFVPIHQFVRIGKCAFVAGGYRLTVDVPPFVKVAGDPSFYIGVNEIGMKRCGYSNDEIKIVKKIYRHLYIENMPFNEFITVLDEYGKFGKMVKEFFENSDKRPILRKSITRRRKDVYL